MSLRTLGNCRHYWEFKASQFSSNAFADQQGTTPAVLNTGTPTYTSANGTQGLDLSSGTQYLTASELEILGEFSVISVIGYRGGFQRGWATLNTTTGFNWREEYVIDRYRIFRAETVFTTEELDQSHVNISIGGVNLDGIAQLFTQVDDNPQVELDLSVDSNAVINTFQDIQFGRVGTTLAPVQQVYESAFYAGDVREDESLDAEIAALKTKYGIS